LPAVIHYINAHVANQAFKIPRLKRLLKKAAVTYCDGAGVAKAAQILGKKLPHRLTLADFVFDMLRAFAKAERKVYILAGDKGLPAEAITIIDEQVTGHTVVGFHHGYILKDRAANQAVIDEINMLKPDIVLVGFGTPLQEFWIDKHKHELDVAVLYAVGAVMDYHTGRLPRCPYWMGPVGLEWLFRFKAEPRRLFTRYIIGNPWFMARIYLRKWFGDPEHNGPAD